MDDEAIRRYCQNPYEGYAELRPHRLTKDPQGFWYVTRYDDIEAVLTDRRFGRKPRPGTEHRLPAAGYPNLAERRAILFIDPPDHTRIRKLLTKAFSAPRIEAMRPTITTLAEKILDGLTNGREEGTFEIMQDFALPIPSTIIADMLGIPEIDRPRITTLSHLIVGSGSSASLDEATARANAQAATTELHDYLRDLFRAKRREPTDDLTTALIRAEDELGQLTEDELTWNVRSLFIAGHETTVNLIGNALVALFNHPNELERLRQNPELMPRAVEEFLRYDSSVQLLFRVAQEDVEIAGQTVLAGELVICLLGSANRDPDVYERPDEFDVLRPFIRSKSFGGGIHFCLGAQLARIETEIALQTLLRRLPNLQITNLGEVQYALNPSLRGPLKLSARWSN